MTLARKPRLFSAPVVALLAIAVAAVGGPASAAAAPGPEAPVLIKDIEPGPEGSSLTGLTPFGGDLYFTAWVGQEYGLWRSDGTEAGTKLVKGGIRPEEMITMGDALYFRDSEQQGIWRSDGTEAGTTLVKEFPSGCQRCREDLTASGGTLFFVVEDGFNNHGAELWESDGTEAGTKMVKDIYPGNEGSNPSELTNVDGTLFFEAEDGHGCELWESDGTEAGTKLVKEINPGGVAFIRDATNVNGTLFFRAWDPSHGEELWESDGTEAGTKLVKDIRPGAEGSDASELTNVNGTLFFQANDGSHGYELWESDGTEAGTKLVKDIYTGGRNYHLSGLTNFNGTLFFEANDGSHGYELWRSDGTEAGTKMVKDIYTGAENSYPFELTNVNGVLFFTASDPSQGRGIWKSDGTEAGTTRVGGGISYGKEIVTEENEETGEEEEVEVERTWGPDYLTAVGGRLYFIAEDPVHGEELWTIGTKSEPTLSSSATAGVALGGEIDDTATLAGTRLPIGTIEFAVYRPNDASCSGAPAFTGSAPVSADGSYESAAFTPTAAGTYRWVTSYSGDIANEAVAGACGGSAQVSTVTGGPSGEEGKKQSPPTEQKPGETSKPKPKKRTGKRAKALAKCRKAFKRNHNGRTFKSCKKRARKLPV